MTTNNVSSVPAPIAMDSVPDTTNTVPSGDAAALTFQAATEVIDNQQAVLSRYVTQVTGSQYSHVPHGVDEVARAMGSVLKLTTMRPVYAAVANPTTLAALVDRVETGEALASALRGLLASVEDTNENNLKSGYALVRAAYNHAAHNDPTDQVVQNLMAPAQALFVKRPRSTVAGEKAGMSTVKKARAEAHAARATTEATTAQEHLDAVVQSITQGASTGRPA